MEELNYKELLLQLMASLTQATCMKDVAGDVAIVCMRLGVPPEWDDLSELGELLSTMGVTTLYDSGRSG